MILGLVVYLFVFLISIFNIYFFQHSSACYTNKVNKTASIRLYCFWGMLFLLPLITMHGLRYGIGTDYFGYELIYDELHNVSVIDYFRNRDPSDTSTFLYIEPGYYLLNRIFPSYRFLLWGIGFIIFGLLLKALEEYRNQVSFAFALFVYLSNNFIYSMNGVRFTIAFGVVLVGYNALIKNDIKKYIVYVLVASLFHQSALFCIAMVFLKQINHKSTNNIRNIALFLSVTLFPLISSFLLKMLGKVSLFERYFSVSRYVPSSTMSISIKWTLHIIPVIVPLLLFCRKEIFESNDTNTLFRVYILEAPFRMIGLYNNLYTRFARYSQIVLVVFLPLVISRLKSKQKRILLYVYYVAWFLFYFVYYAVALDEGDSIPYTWIFSH